MDQSELEQHVANAIRTTINRFRGQPERFFTESDLHSYCYSRIQNGKLLIRRQGQRHVYLLHREYPTNFRYHKERLLEPGYVSPVLESSDGSRGNYDLAVLNPTFAQQATFLDARNKEIGGLRLRCASGRDTTNELLFAIEFKFMYCNLNSFLDEVQRDHAKLLHADECQAMHAINLVFCDDDGSFTHVERLRNAVVTADRRIISLFIRRVTNPDGSRQIADPVVGNHSDWARWFQGRTKDAMPSWELSREPTGKSH